MRKTPKKLNLTTCNWIECFLSLNPLSTEFTLHLTLFTFQTATQSKFWNFWKTSTITKVSCCWRLEWL